MRPMLSVLVLFPVVLLNISCSSTPEIRKIESPLNNRLGSASNPVLLSEPLSKYGNPPFYEVNGQRYYTLRSSQGYEAKGVASWYGSKFQGRRTSSGEIYDMYAMTAAHRTLPLPSYVAVTNLNNGRQIIVRVNDRGPFYANRIIDLSYAAAMKLGLVKPGTGLVEIRAIEPEELSSPKEIASREGFYLQVGAFQNRSYAEQLQRRLQSIIDAAVKVSPVPEQQTSFYHVRIGPFSSTERLHHFAKRLADLGFPHPIVVH